MVRSPNRPSHPSHPSHPTGGEVSFIRKVVEGRLIPLAVVAVGLVAGPAFAMTVFPEASLAKQVLGGWIAGVYFSMCAIPEYFLDL